MDIANNLGWSNASLRTGFNAEMAERHAALAKAAAKSVKSEMFVESIPELEPTVTMYYDDVMRFKFDAKVVGCLPLVGNDIPEFATHAIILDSTCFLSRRRWSRSRFWSIEKWFKIS